METFVLVTGAWHGGWSWRPVATLYVLSTDDVALPPGEYGWTRFPERLGVTPIETPGSHEANFTRPDELADAFLRAAGA